MSASLIDIGLDLCDSLLLAISPSLQSFGGTITVNAVDIPVYVTMPKIAPSEYVYIGGVIQTEDGTKDDFIYKGTVQIRVTTERNTPDKKLAYEILNAVRGMIKPTKSSVFTMTNSTLVVFKHESLSELVGQADNGTIRIDLVDLFSFIID